MTIEELEKANEYLLLQEMPPNDREQFLKQKRVQNATEEISSSRVQAVVAGLLMFLIAILSSWTFSVHPGLWLVTMVVIGAPGLWASAGMWSQAWKDIDKNKQIIKNNKT